jgi:DhnA family fructose-bisphosphate aldolase class Ia
MKAAKTLAQCTSQISERIYIPNCRTLCQAILIVKVNFPKVTFDPEAKNGTPPPPYNDLDIDEFEAFRQVVESAGDSFVLVSGGSKTGDDELLRKVELSMKAGATGLIFGRNMWLRPMEEALALTEKVKEIMSKY